jgi:hypothetical protein
VTPFSVRLIDPVTRSMSSGEKNAFAAALVENGARE